MAPHSSTLAWKIPWTEEPGRLQSMGSLRVRHDWATSLSLFTFMLWRRTWQATPVFLPGESQGWEPGGLPSMGLHRVKHEWSDLAAADSFMRAPWSSPCRMSSFTHWQLNCWTDLIADELVEYMLPFWNGLYRHEVDKASRCVTPFLPRGKCL